MKRLDYTNAVATMRVYEKRLLDSVKIDRMVDAASAEDVLKILSETEYSKAMVGLNGPHDFEQALKNELERVYGEMYRLTVDKNLIEILALKYDYQNIKALLKGSASGEDAGHILQDMGTIPMSEIRSNFESGNLNDYDPHIKGAINESKEDFEKNKDPQRIDLIVDRYYFSHLGELAEKADDVPIIKAYVKYTVDTFNLLSLLRAKNQDKNIRFVEGILVDGGNIQKSELLSVFGDSYESIANKLRKYPTGPVLKKGIENFIQTGRLGELEKLLENGQMKIIKPSKQVVFGPEPLFSYVVAKERENKLLRIILVSKLNNISADKTRERLRDIYV